MDAEGLYLFSPDSNTHVSINQGVPTHGKRFMVKLGADLKCRDVRPGKKGWHRARLVLAQHDGNAYSWGVPHVVAQVDGTRPWRSCQGVFEVLPRTREIRVIAVLSRCAGVLSVRDVFCYPVVENVLYQRVQKGLLVCWGGFFLLLGGSMAGSAGRKGLRVLAPAAVGAIVFATMIPGEIKTALSLQLLALFQGMGGRAGHVDMQLVYKVGHFCFFMGYGMVAAAIMRHWSVWVLVLSVVMLAGATELVQNFIDLRNPSFQDFVIDIAGGLIPVMAERMFRRAGCGVGAAKC